MTNLNAIQIVEFRQSVLEGIADIEQGRYSEYEGRVGLAQLTADVKARGRKRLQEESGR